MERSKIMEFALRSLMKDTQDMFFFKDINLVYLSASQSFLSLVGLNNPEDIVGKTDADLFRDPEIAKRYTDDDKRLLATGKPLSGYIEPLDMADGTRGYCQTSKYPVFDNEGTLIGVYGVARDITREYRAKLDYEKELSALFQLPAHALAAALFDATAWRLVDIKLSDTSPAKTLKYQDLQALIQDSAEKIEDNEEAQEFYRSCSKESIRSLYDNGKRRMVLEYRRIFGQETRWVRTEMHFLIEPISGHLCVVWILLDIDGRKRAAHELIRAVQRDALTNVYNRETTMSRIQEFLTGEGVTGTHMLFMIDVDNFKMVNDTFGHQTGDEVLVKIATAIQKIFRQSDIVGRVGGDEFFALMKDVATPQTAMKRAKALVEALQYVCADGELKVELSGSVGISCYAGDEKPLDQLYQEADNALYRAKQTGKNRFAFASQMLDHVNMEQQAEQDAARAIHLQVLLENMDGTIIQAEIKGGEIKIVYASQSLFTVWGYDPAQVGSHGEKFWSIVLPEEVEPLKSAICAAAQSNIVLHYDYQVFGAQGQREWQHICASCLPDQGDGICRTINLITNITKQKQIENELREKDQIIDFAMRNTDVNLWHFDFDKKRCDLTLSCQKAHEMPGVEYLDNFPESLFEIGYVREDSIDVLRNAYEELRLTGISAEFDAWYRKADGSGWWCERDMLTAVFDSDGRVVGGIGIGKNVTVEKEMEQKFQTFQAYRRLAQSNTRASYRMNITTGWMGDAVTSEPQIEQDYAVNNIDDFYNIARTQIMAQEDVERCNAVFERDALLQAFERGETLRSVEYRYRSLEGRTIWLRSTIEMMRNPVTGDVEALFYTEDIDHDKNMRLLVDKLLDDDYEFLGLIDLSSEQIMVFGYSTEVKDGARDGGNYDQEMHRVFRELIADEYYEEGVRTMSTAHVIEELKNKDFYSCSFPAKDYAHTHAGRKQWKFSYLDEAKSKILMVRTDITNLYTAERDALTGLYNREAFYRKTREILDAHADMQFVLIRFDIDRFKAYNDVCGVQSGDRLLSLLGSSVRDSIWPKYTLFGRLEADHFVALMPADFFDVDEWMGRHAEWMKGIATGYLLTSSMGIYRISDRSLNIALMCDRALLALRTVKDSYTNKVAWYDEGLRVQLMKEQSLIDDMELALHNGQFQVYFQPLIHYSDRTIVGAEALVRWLHPKRGLIPPEEFIPLFEKNGFILKLDSFVWEKSCQCLRRWLDEQGAISPVPFSVNISRCDLYDPELSNRLCGLMEKYQLPLSLLKLEITESAYMEDPNQLIEVVGQLRSMGFVVEMDDFGTGYSSLNMLKDVPVDVLKLDTRFLSESEHNDRATTILSSIISMANDLGLLVIAEGVETKAQAELLKDLDCYLMQGYYFGCPMREEEFEMILRAKGNFPLSLN